MPSEPQYSRFPCRAVLLKVMLEASCSGTGWELILQIETQIEIFPVFFPSHTASPIHWQSLQKNHIQLAAQPLKLACLWDKVRWWVGFQVCSATQHFIHIMNTALGVVSLTIILREKTLEHGNKITDRKARVKRFKDSWFCYCLLIWVG